MRVLRALGIACIAASPVCGQAIYQPPAADTSGATATAQQALATAQAAQTTANAAVTPSALNSAIASITFPVTSVNGSQGVVTVPVPNLSGYATTASVTSALAPYATTSSVASSITAATPATCGTPLPDTYGGSAGSAATCMPRSDASRPTIVQAVNATTASDGSWSASWPTSFSANPTVATATILGGTPPYICSILTKSAMTVTGRCYQVVSTTLPTVTTSLLGLVISPIISPTAGLPVMIVGRL